MLGQKIKTLKTVCNTGFLPTSTSPGLLQAYRPQQHTGLLASSHRQAPAHRRSLQGLVLLPRTFLTPLLT